MIREFEHHDLRVTELDHPHNYHMELLSKSGDLLHGVRYVANWKKGLPATWGDDQWTSLLNDTLADMERRGAIKA